MCKGNKVDEACMAVIYESSPPRCVETDFQTYSISIDQQIDKRGGSF